MNLKILFSPFLKHKMKRSYHSDLILQYKLNLLPDSVKCNIPSSTLHNWKNKDMSKLFGSDFVHDFHDNIDMIKDILRYKRLLKSAKALYHIHATFLRIFQSVKSNRNILRKNKSELIKTIDSIKQFMDLKRVTRLFGISLQQYYHWKKQVSCNIDSNVFCRKMIPTQLSHNETTTIRNYITNEKFRHWSLSSIHFQLLRDKAAFFSRTTFYKYAKQIVPYRPIPKKNKYNTGIRALSPKSVLHMDVTIFKTMDNTKVYIYFLVDNYSRYILNWKASFKYSSKITLENLLEANKKYQLNKHPYTIDLISDGGTENKGVVDRYTSNPKNNIRKLLALIAIRFSNSIVEAVNKRIKYDFLFRTDILNFKHLIKYLEWAVEQYNLKPHYSLYGLCPTEVFNGAIPNKHMFSEAIKEAGSKRIQENKLANCLNCY